MVTGSWIKYIYILNQEEHHKEKNLRNEYLQILHDYCVDYKEEYLFEFYDEDWWNCSAVIVVWIGTLGSIGGTATRF